MADGGSGAPPLDLMQWYCRRPSSSNLLVQAYIIIACIYDSATNLVVAQVGWVENPCLICPDGATAGDDFTPYCKTLVQSAKIFENGDVRCNYLKGLEMTCCPGAITPPSTTLGIPDTTTTTTTTTSPTSSITTNNPTIVAPKTSYVPTPSPTPTNPLYIVEVTAAIVGSIAALVGAAFAFARWKQKMNSPTSTPAIPTAAATSP